MSKTRGLYKMVAGTYAALFAVPAIVFGLPMVLLNGGAAWIAGLFYVIASALLSLGFTWALFHMMIVESRDLKEPALPGDFKARVKGHFSNMRSSGVDVLLVMVVLGYLAASVPFGFAFALAGDLTTADSLYQNILFSINLFATVSLGDVTPKGFGHTLASIEVIFGLLYQVMVIALAIELIVPKDNRRAA